ncbi:MAG: TIGR03546 family protein [Pseudomonadota bacterium]
MLTLLAKLLKALNSETSPWALAMAMVLGMVLGLTPLWRLHNLLILLAALIFRVNLSLFLLSFAIFSGIAYLLDPVFHQLGLTILNAQSWQGIYEAMYATALGRVSQFYHTITMGSLVVSILLSPVLAVVSYFVINNYRNKIKAHLLKLKVVQLIRGSRFWRLYMDLRR